MVTLVCYDITSVPIWCHDKMNLHNFSQHFSWYDRTLKHVVTEQIVYLKLASNDIDLSSVYFVPSNSIQPPGENASKRHSGHRVAKLLKYTREPW